MLKIIICLLLVTGVLSLLDENNLADVIKPDKVQNTDSNKDTDSSETDVPNEKNPADINSIPAAPEVKTNNIPPQLNLEQINMLADKVIRIHGVKPDSTDEDNLKNINDLRKVVAGVEKNLNEKLKLAMANAKEKNNDKAPENKEPAPDVVETLKENETPDEHIEEVSPNDDSNVPEANNNEPQNINEDIPAKDPEPSEITNPEGDIPTEANTKANEETEKEDISESGESQINIEPDTESQNISEDKPEATDEISETKTDETENINANEEISADDSVSDDTEQSTVTIESVAESIVIGSNNDSIPETNKNEEVGDIEEDEEDTNNLERNSDEDEDNAEISTVEEADEQTNINEDVSERSAEIENGNIEDIKEEEISGTCNLNEDCDQSDDKKPHAYTEEYNTPVIKEEELEDEIEDTHLQRVIKFFSSFIN